MSDGGKLHICCRTLSQVFISIMQRNKYGRIVNVLDLIGSLHQMGCRTSACGVSKVALNVLTHKLTAELRGTSILLDAIDPGRMERRYEWSRSFQSRKEH